MCENPMIPMIALTGRPDKPQIYDYLSGLKHMGFDSCLIYPRDGCELDYLTEEWFTACENVFSSAEDLNMTVWLYDEFNWPSGQAGGLVQAAKPDFCLKHLHVTEENGKTAIKLLPSVYPNVLSFDAVNHFISLTHEVYYKRFGKYFGNVIKGIFTDEPAFGYGAKDNVYTYYDGLGKDYTAMCGRNLYADILSPTDEFKATYYRLLSERFASVYAKQLTDWCCAHGIIMTGHVYNDSSVTTGFRDCGNIPEVLKNFSLPGIDEIRTSGNSDRNLWLFSVAEYASRHSSVGTMAEIFALGPADMGFRTMRQMIGMLGLFGVDTYFLAISHLDCRGNVRKKDFFNDHSHTRPDKNGYLLLKDEAIIASKIAGRKRKATVKIRYCQNEYAHVTRTERIALLNKTYIELLSGLLKAQVDWTLLGENDAKSPEDVVILAVKDGIFFDEISGKSFAAVQDTVDFAAAAVWDTDFVLNTNGSLAQNVFVRRFADGGIAVVNLSAAESYELIMRINGIEIPFTLDAGQLVTDRDLTVPAASETPLEPKSMELRLKDRQFFRLPFTPTENEITFYAEDGIKAANLHMRSYSTIRDNRRLDLTGYVPPKNSTADEVNEITLDGKAVTADLPADSLPINISTLYKTAEPISLSCGEHRAKIAEGHPDFKYLPSALLTGNFIVDYEKMSLKAPESSVMYDTAMKFYGCASLSSKVTVPADADALFAASHYFIEVYADGEKVCDSISSVRWFIPEDLRGKQIELELRVYSDETAVFGNVKHFEENDPNAAVRNMYPNHKGRPLVETLTWQRLK